VRSVPIVTITPPVLALLLAASTASAAITIDTVFVGDAGNTGEDQSQGTFGAVAYDYHIGTHEVTNSQYTAFLNAVAATDTLSLYNSNMGTSDFGGISRSGSDGNYSYSTRTNMADKPVNYVSFWDAARFANWLTNGQPTGAQGSGTTEDGMYDLGGDTDPTNTNVSRQLVFSNGENGVAIASENEWYKAAYYDGSGDYYLYPTQNDSAPTVVGPEDATGSNNANYDNAVESVTDVGAYADSASHYGTFDQGGNVREWNDEIVFTSSRGMRGGFFSGAVSDLQSSSRNKFDPTTENNLVGFRVTSLAPIPEPSSYGAIFGIVGLATAIFFRRKRRRG